jgi:hypothetical protein
VTGQTFGFGPAWARGSGCCAKPEGCSIMTEPCLMLNHPWKRWHREKYGQEPAAPAAGPDDCPRDEAEEAAQ